MGLTLVSSRLGLPISLAETGKPLREFMHVDDLADACYFLMRQFDEPGFLNIGTGTDHRIKALAQMIAEEVGFTGEIVHDFSKPDGTPRKLMDVSRLTKLGWSAKISLRDGLKQVYAGLKGQDWY